MQDLKNKLQNSLKGATRVAVLGIGSELRSDDIAGILVAQAIKETPSVKVFLGYTAPENLTGEIRKFAPSHLIMVDSAEIGKGPGSIRLISPEQAVGISFSTHKLPMKMMADYLMKTLECKVLLIGIQPKSLEFGGELSEEVKSAVKDVTKTLAQVLTME